MLDDGGGSILSAATATMVHIVTAATAFCASAHWPTAVWIGYRLDRKENAGRRIATVVPTRKCALPLPLAAAACRQQNVSVRRRQASRVLPHWPAACCKECAEGLIVILKEA